MIDNNCYLDFSSYENSISSQERNRIVDSISKSVREEMVNQFDSLISIKTAK